MCKCKNIWEKNKQNPKIKNKQTNKNQLVFLNMHFLPFKGKKPSTHCWNGIVTPGLWIPCASLHKSSSGDSVQEYQSLQQDLAVQQGTWKGNWFSWLSDIFLPMSPSTIVWKCCFWVHRGPLCERKVRDKSQDGFSVFT